MNVNKKSIDNLGILICLIIIHSVLIFSRPVLYFAVNRGYINSASPLAGMMNFLFSITGIIQTFISILLVLKCRKAGFGAQFCINSLSGLLIIWIYIRSRDVTVAAGIAGSVLAIIISGILYQQMSSIRADIAELDRITFSDDLTGLANRKKIVSVMSNLIGGEEAVPDFAILFVDMDNFKIINDSLGHQIGDIFLNEAVHNTRLFLEDSMTFGRMGGDEFLIIVPYFQSTEELFTLGKSVNKAVATPFLYKSRNYVVTCSIGVARYPNDGTCISDLLRCADMAMYQSKIHGRNRTMFFNDNMRFQLEKKVQMEHELHNVIENRELYVEFQPQFFLEDRHLRGFEALTRWDSPILGKIPPATFIPLAEENGDIITIGKWVMLQSFTDYMKICSAYDPAPVLAVNISVVQFRDPSFLEDVKEVLNMTGMKPENLEFEITESVCITSPEAAKKKLDEIHALGIKIALDDFGTGYSSLSYLRSLPFDILKVDKSFIDTILSVPEHENLVKTIIEMSHQLNMQVIAEGIEQEKQMLYLKKNGCDIVQGNYFSKPVPVFAL